MLELRNVRKCFRAGGGQIRAVDGLSLELQGGELVAVLGPSGSGKTTLLLLAAGLLRPDAGEVLFEGRDLARADKRDLLKHRRAHLGFVQQNFNLVPGMSVEENVALPLLLRHMSRANARANALQRLDEVGLAQRASHMPEQLSGGEQQRAAIARALVGLPRLVLADEPTGNLDSATGEAVVERLSMLAREHGVAVLLVTHDTRLAPFADRQLSMRDGRISEGVTEPTQG